MLNQNSDTEGKVLAEGARELAAGPWREHFTRQGEIRVAKLSRGGYRDSPTVFLVTIDGQKSAVISASSAVAPWLVDRAAERARKAQVALSDLVPNRVAVPLAVTSYRGVSWSLTEYFDALRSDRLGRLMLDWQIARVMFHWLADIARLTGTELADADRLAEAQTSLEAMASSKALDANLTRAALSALSDLNSGNWIPLLTLTHGDLWRGNIMRLAGRSTSLARSLVVIDWAGSRTDGWALFDLLRIVQSLRVPKLIARKQVIKHCRLLNMPSHAGRHSVVAALASIYSNLEHFPLEDYAIMASNTLRTYDALNIDRRREHPA